MNFEIYAGRFTVERQYAIYCPEDRDLYGQVYDRMEDAREDAESLIDSGYSVIRVPFDILATSGEVAKWPEIYLLIVPELPVLDEYVRVLEQLTRSSPTHAATLSNIRDLIAEIRAQSVRPIPPAPPEDDPSEPDEEWDEDEE